MMNFTKAPQVISSLGLAAALFEAAFYAAPARANIYATDIRLDGGTTNVTTSAGSTVAINYILNEAATRGVTLDILSADQVVRSMTFTNGQPGALRGTNTAVWDLKDNNGSQVPIGTYSVSITAAAQGYSAWTQLTDDNNPGNYVWEGRGIAVDQNPNSLYYGRVFVANSQPGPNGQDGDNVGLLLLNADGSPAEGGEWQSGGYPWAGDGYSPWHVEVGSDDRVYVEDWTLLGAIISWDPTLSATSEVSVLNQSNWGTNDQGGYVSLSGPAVVGSGTNMSLWMADAKLVPSDDPSLGILRYALISSSTNQATVAPGDLGSVEVGVTNDVTLTNAINYEPYDVALDRAGNIYTIQFVTTAGDPHPRVLRFPAPPTNGTNTAPELFADWGIGAGSNTMGRATGVAVDPTGTYVAVAFGGIDSAGLRTNGCTQVFYATNGAPVVNLDLGVTINQQITHEDTDVAWDAVGNVYYIDNYSTVPVWRSFSPPGTNQATTLAVPMIQVGNGGGGGTNSSITITGFVISNGTVTISFQASASAAPSAFSVLAAGAAEGPYTNAAAATITRGANPGDFVATISAAGGILFYRIQGPGSVPSSNVTLDTIQVSGGNVTLAFSGSTSDTPAAFTILSASSLTGQYSAAQATVTQTAPGQFQATLATNGPVRFYRVSK